MRPRTIALALAAFAAGVGVPAAVGAASAIGTPAAVVAAPQAAVVPQAASCSGVWVVVDFGSLGGTSTKCATSHGTGVAALKSAGFSPVVEDGFVYKISGKPSKPDINKAYWSYWTATKNGDGSYSDWKYSNVGASSSRPKQGNAEGWHYVSLSAGNTPPGAKPPAAETEKPKPKPTPTKTTSKPTPKPTKPTAKPTKTPTKTPSKSASATASATKSATRAASASATTSPTATATATSTATSPASTVPASVEASETSPDGSETPQEQAEPAPDSGTGSPVGAIVAGSVVVAGAAGVGGWWMMKGRKR